MFDIFQYIQLFIFNLPITPLLCLWKSYIILTKFVTYYSQYYANIRDSGLIFEVGDVMSATPQK